MKSRAVRQKRLSIKLLTNLRGKQITFFRQHFTTRRRNDIFTPSVQVREQPREASL